MCDTRSMNIGFSILQSTVRSMTVFTAVAQALGLLRMMSCQGRWSTVGSGQVVKQCACARSQTRLAESREANFVLDSRDARSAFSTSGPLDIAEEVAISIRCLISAVVLLHPRS